MQKYQNNVQTLDGRAIVGAAVTVTQYPGGAPATVYTANGSGVITQPILTNGDGEFSFYAANGRYQLQVTGGGISVAQTITDVSLFDPDDAVGGVITQDELANTEDVTKGDALVGVKQPFTGAVARTQHDKNVELLSVQDFGLNVGVDATAAVQAMIAAVGYARFSSGLHKLTTVTLDAPLYFDYDAAITVDVGNTITITGDIESPVQFIFQGAGTYALGNDGDSGENARQVHVSWFGAFPKSDDATDQAPAISKCFASVGNVREAEVVFDIGRYSVGANMVVPRACHLKGNGTRRTIFSLLSDGWDVFTTGGVGVRISGIQSELAPSSGLTSRTSLFIRVSHSECDIYDVLGGRADRSIVVNGGNCRVSNVVAVYDVAPAAGSSFIEVLANGCTIDGVLVPTSAFGPSAIVRLGGPNATANLSNLSVRKLQWVTPSIGVHVDATAFTIGRFQIRDLEYAGLAGTNAPNIIKTETAGATSVSDGVISGVTASNAATNGLLFQQGSSASTENIVISDVVIDGSSGYGASFAQTAGTFSNVFASDTVDLRQRTTPFQFSGNTAGVAVSPQITPAANTPISYDFTIADDGVASVTLRRSVFTGMAMITVANAEYGIFMTRAAATPNSTSIAVSANMNATNVALTGTTGTDGKFTLGVTDGVLYFENRLGSSQRVSVSLLYGIQ